MGHDFRWSVHFYNEGYNFERNKLNVTLTNNKSGQVWVFKDQKSDGEYTVKSIWGDHSVVFASKDFRYAEGLIGAAETYQFDTKLYNLIKEYEVEEVKVNFGH